MLNTESFRMQSFNYYLNKYMNQLREPVCVPYCLTELCSGWHQETFKQVMNKLSKNKTAPIPLYFTAVEAMDLISHKQPMLREVYALMDTRNTKRIDAMELYMMLLLAAKADYDTVLKCAVDVFGVEEAGSLTRGELFYIIDALFRSLSKFLIVKGETRPTKVNTRLDCQEINGFMNKLVLNKSVSKNDIRDTLDIIPQLSSFLRYVHARVSQSASFAREEALRTLKIEVQVKILFRSLYEQIEKRVKQAGK